MQCPNRPFKHSSQPHARKHESEARVDNNQTWRRTVRVLRLVVVVNLIWNAMRLQRRCQMNQINVNLRSKLGMSPKLDVIEQLFMFLVWLRCGFAQKHLAWLFGIGKSTVSRYLITRSNYMYFCLGTIPIWPSKDQAISSMRACRRGSSGGEMGEFSPPPTPFFFWAPLFRFFSYPSNIEIIFDFSCIITKIHPPFQNTGSALGMF